MKFTSASLSMDLSSLQDSLQWIDQNSAVVQKKLEEVQKLHEIRMKEIDRVGIF